MASGQKRVLLCGEVGGSLGTLYKRVASVSVICDL